MDADCKLAAMRLLVAYRSRFENFSPRTFKYVLTRGEEALPFLKHMLDIGVDINELEHKGTALHIAVTVDDLITIASGLCQVADTRFGPFGLTAAD